MLLTVGFHLYEAPAWKQEGEWWLPGTGERRTGSWCLVGMEFEVGKMKKVWMVVVDAQQCEIHFFNVYFFILRGAGRGRERERQRQKERESQAGSTLSAEPNVRLDLKTMRS